MLRHAVVFAMAVVAIYAYGEGAPPSACLDMIPGHGVPPQSSPSPYTVTTSTKVVKAGTPMEVVISGKTPSNTIRGLLLQARHGDKPVGTFTIPSNEPFQLLNCGAPGNAVTHKMQDPNKLKQTVTFTWTPPADLNDVIAFRATVAYSYSIFWVGLESEPVQVIN